jgi:hypothetical protein
MTRGGATDGSRARRYASRPHWRPLAGPRAPRPISWRISERRFWPLCCSTRIQSRLACASSSATRPAKPKTRPGTSAIALLLLPTPACQTGRPPLPLLRPQAGVRIALTKVWPRTACPASPRRRLLVFLRMAFARANLVSQAPKAFLCFGAEKGFAVVGDGLPY